MLATVLEDPVITRSGPPVEILLIPETQGYTSHNKSRPLHFANEIGLAQVDDQNRKLSIYFWRDVLILSLPKSPVSSAATPELSRGRPGSPPSETWWGGGKSQDQHPRNARPLCRRRSAPSHRAKNKGGRQRNAGGLLHAQSCVF